MDLYRKFGVVSVQKYDVKINSTKKITHVNVRVCYAYVILLAKTISFVLFAEKRQVSTKKKISWIFYILKYFLDFTVHPCVGGSSCRCLPFLLFVPCCVQII